MLNTVDDEDIDWTSSGFQSEPELVLHCGEDGRTVADRPVAPRGKRETRALWIELEIQVKSVSQSRSIHHESIHEVREQVRKRRHGYPTGLHVAHGSYRYDALRRLAWGLAVTRR